MIHSLVAESEYNASTKVCYKMLFICVFYLFMGIVVKYPYRSTRWQIWSNILSKTASVNPHTNQVDVHQCFICGYIESVTIKVQFFPFRGEPCGSIHKEPGQQYVSRAYSRVHVSWVSIGGIKFACHSTTQEHSISALLREGITG